jgi:hypothetical protein
MSNLNVGKIISTAGIVFPSFTDSTRPSNPEVGMVIFNTTTKSLEVWNGSSWTSFGKPGIEAEGGTVTDITIGGINYRVHAFTAVGTSTFTVTRGGQADVLIVAGGGAGGSQNGSGGGAGGLIYRPNLSISTQSYNITVGNGSQVSVRFPTNERGENSSAFELTSIGGGNGGGDDANGVSGGSGGGSADNPNMTGGSGLQPSQSGDSGSFGFGNRGGNTNSFNNDGGTGGGGAGEPGRDHGQDPGYNGGIGRDYSNIFGSSFGENGYFAGGGGGFRRTVTSPFPPAGSGSGGMGLGGQGGGGNGLSGTGEAGQPNTGGGGGGGGGSGGLGGSGIVIVRYPI